MSAPGKDGWKTRLQSEGLETDQIKTDLKVYTTKPEQYIYHLMFKDIAITSPLTKVHPVFLIPLQQPKQKVAKLRGCLPWDAG